MEKKEWFIDSHNRNIKDDYHFIEKIASGGFGIVYLAEHRKTGEKYAIKAIQKKKVKDFMTFQNEIKLLRVLDHPNIIKLYEIWEWNDVCFLVLEYCQGGELFQYIIDQKNITESKAALIMKQLFSALKYLHEQSISHRDIKPENFMLLNNGDITNMKLIDFGLSKDYSGQPPYYIAPEVFQQQYTSKIDLWSMGVVLYILLSGKVPFPGHNELEIITNVIKGDFHFHHEAFKNVSDDCKDLIRQLLIKLLLNKDVQKRISAHEAINHRWIVKYAGSEEDSQVQPGFVFDSMRATIDGVKSRKATLIELAQKIPEESFEDLKTAFRMNDENQSGKLNHDDFVRCLKIANMNGVERDIQQLLSVLDQGSDGVIEYDEFSNSCFLAYLFQKEYKLRQMFEYLDKEKSGIITLQQLRSIIESEHIGLSSDQLDRIFKKELKVDLSNIDSNDVINYNLFISCLRREYNRYPFNYSYVQYFLLKFTEFWSRLKTKQDLFYKCIILQNKIYVSQFMYLLLQNKDQRLVIKFIQIKI